MVPPGPQIQVTLYLPSSATCGFFFGRIYALMFSDLGQSAPAAAVECMSMILLRTAQTSFVVYHYLQVSHNVAVVAAFSQLVLGGHFIYELLSMFGQKPSISSTIFLAVSLCSGFAILSQPGHTSLSPSLST